MCVNYWWSFDTHTVHVCSHNVCENYHVVKYLQLSYFLAISGTDKPIFVCKTLKKAYAFSVHLVLYLKQ